MELLILRGEQPAWAASGYGSGSGYGYGYGSGSGSGSGYGDGDGSYWLKCIKYFALKWTDAQRARLEQLQALGTKVAFWKSDQQGKACNGGKNKPVSVGTIEKVDGPLELCSRRALHATALLPKWKGDRIWVVALHGEVVGDDEKLGALEREIIGEVLDDRASKGA